MFPLTTQSQLHYSQPVIGRGIRKLELLGLSEVRWWDFGEASGSGRESSIILSLTAPIYTVSWSTNQFLRAFDGDLSPGYGMLLVTVTTTVKNQYRKFLCSGLRLWLFWRMWESCSTVYAKEGSDNSLLERRVAAHDLRNGTNKGERFTTFTTSSSTI